MNKLKLLLLSACLVGMVSVPGQAQGWLKNVTKASVKSTGRNYIKKPAAVLEAEKLNQLRWTYRVTPEADLRIGQALLAPKLPAIGETSLYARKVQLGEHLLPKISSNLSEKLVARHIVEAGFPGYITNFGNTFRSFKEQSDLSWTQELRKTLDSYGEGARFSGNFVPSFERAVNYLETATNWVGASVSALNDAWLSGIQRKSGFFVIGVRQPGGLKDVLLLDVKEKRFISLGESKRLAEDNK